MEKFVLSTDSTADLTKSLQEECGVSIVSIPFFVDETEYSDYDALPPEEFYSKLRNGADIKTALINEAMGYDYLEGFAKAGKNVLHICFSSALSGTYECMKNAAQKINEKYPDIKVIVVDSVSASMGEGMVCYYADKFRKAGLSLEEAADKIDKFKYKICHYFTVETLSYLRKGGRMSALTFMLGSILQIKPILHVDNEGRLIPVAKSLGRRKSLSDMANKVIDRAKGEENEVVFISHGDCPDDAKYIGDILSSRMGVSNIVYGYVGSAVGAHSGPGTVAVFFVGRNRIERD